MPTEELFKLKTDEEYFPCMFGKQEANPEDYKEMVRALEKAAKIRDDISVHYTSGVSKSVLTESTYDQYGNLIDQKVTESQTPIDTYEQSKAAAERYEALRIAASLRFTASKFIHAKLDKFPKHVYDIKPVVLDSGNTFEVSPINLLKDCGAAYDPEKAFKTTYSGLKFHVCNMPNLRIISVLVLLFALIQFVTKGIGILGQLPVPFAPDSKWLSLYQEHSLTLCAIFIFLCFMIFCGYDIIKLTFNFLNFFGFDGSVPIVILAIEGLFMLICSYVYACAYLIPHFFGERVAYSQLTYEQLQFFHLDKIAIVMVIVLFCMEVIRAVFYVYLRNCMRAQFLEDAQNYLDRFPEKYRTLYKTSRFFVLWGKQAHQSVPTYKSRFDKVKKYYYDVQKLIDKNKNKKQQTMWTIPESVSAKAGKVGMKVENFLAITLVVATVGLVGFLIWNNRAYLKEASGYNSYVEHQQEDAAKEEKLLSFRSDYYDDYFVSSKDANAMESSGDVIAMCEYFPDGTVSEQLQFIYDGKLIDVWLNGESDGNITDLGSGPVYGVLNDGYSAYVLCKDKVLTCRDGEYETHKDHKWLADYKKLKQDKLYDHLYDILMKQNVKSDDRFPVEDVAMVSYARTIGTLLRFTEEGNAYFAEDHGDTLRVYKQTVDGNRDVLFELNDYSYHGKGYKYFLIYQFIIYVNDDKVMLYDFDADKGLVYLDNGRTINHMNYMIDQNGDLILCYSDDEKVYIHNMDRNIGIQIREEYDYADIQGIYSAGEYFVYVDSNALSSGDTFSYKKIHVTPDIYEN